MKKLVCVTGWERTSNAAVIFFHHCPLCSLSKVPTLLLGDPFAKYLFSLLNTGDKYGKVRSLVFGDFITEKSVLMLTKHYTREVAGVVVCTGPY